MYYEVYIDIVFLTNLLMDYVLLRLVGSFFRCRKSRKRCLLAAVLGAAVSCLILWIPTESRLPAAILIHGFCAMGMLKISCGFRKSGTLLKAVAALYLTAFLCGGFWEVLTAEGGLTLKTFLMSAALTYFFLSAVLRLADSVRTQRRNIYPVTLLYQGKVQSEYGFYDTGNLLADPINGAPVSVISPGVLQELLPGKSAEKLEHIKENPGELKSTDLKGLHPHFLTCTTVGQEAGLLLAVTLEELIIHTPGEMVHISGPVFALSFEPYALGNEYRVLLNSRLLH